MDDNDLRQDPMQQSDDFFNPNRDEERLPEDNESPATPPLFTDDDGMPVDFPTTDTDIDVGGQYFGGTAEEAGYVPNPEEAADEVFPLEPDDDVN